MISDVTMVRMEASADASFALIRERKRFGIATAARTKIMVTTMSNSISENPFCLRLISQAPSVTPDPGHSRDRDICPLKVKARIRPLRGFQVNILLSVACGIGRLA